KPAPFSTSTTVFAKGLDADAARMLKASIESGVLSNTYNSSQHRFTAQGKRKARTQNKQAERETNAKKKRKTGLSYFSTSINS
ncbi:hypothetical protein BDQ17DRAFT_1347006, partial [Cyathus striatus]